MITHERTGVKVRFKSHYRQNFYKEVECIQTPKNVGQPKPLTNKKGIGKVLGRK